MNASIRSKFFVTQQLVPAVINGLINGVIAWATHRGASVIGLWDQGAYANDLLATGFLLPAITWFILRPLLHRQAALGNAFPLEGLSPPWLGRWMPSSLWGGALAIGLIGLVLPGGCAVLLMQILGAPAFSGTAYALFKGLYGAVVTLALQPVMVFAALRHRPLA